MKKLAVIFALLIALGACSDPVFYTISKEIVEAKPFIPGSPSNFVNYAGNMYVASGRSIYEYNNGNVSKISSPGGWIKMLAATSNYLYALCYQEGGESTLKRYSSGGVWSDVVGGDRGGYNLLQSVYAINNTVFIGAGKNEDGMKYSILQITGDSPTSTFSPLTTTADVTGELCGVAFASSNYFLCLKGDGNGILYGSTSYSAVPESGKKFYGIINLGTTNNIVAITDDGKLYSVAASLTPLDASMGNTSTGALAVWTKGTDNLLLVGRKDSNTPSTSSGYTYGYMEIEFGSSGITGSFNEPGKVSPSTVGGDYERYVSTIGKYAINHIYQFDGILFASTQKNGVWSLRERNDILIWNAQE